MPASSLMIEVGVLKTRTDKYQCLVLSVDSLTYICRVSVDVRKLKKTDVLATLQAANYDRIYQLLGQVLDGSRQAFFKGKLIEV